MGIRFSIRLLNRQMSLDRCRQNPGRPHGAFDARIANDILAAHPVYRMVGPRLDFLDVKLFISGMPRYLLL